MNAAWTILSVGRENASNFFNVRFRFHDKIKTVCLEGGILGDDKIKTVTSDRTQQNKNTDVTGVLEVFPKKT